MASDESLRRIDAHMERGNRLMERVEAELRQNRAAYAYGHTVLSDLTQVLSRIDSHIEGLTRHIAELTDEVKAQRGAILAMIDRLQNGGASPATG